MQQYLPQSSMYTKNGLQSFKKGNYGLALQFFEKGAQNYPKNPKFVPYIILTQIYQQKYNTAIKNLIRFYQLNLDKVPKQECAELQRILDFSQSILNFVKSTQNLKNQGRKKYVKQLLDDFKQFFFAEDFQKEKFEKEISLLKEQFEFLSAAFRQQEQNLKDKDQEIDEFSEQLKAKDQEILTLKEEIKTLNEEIITLKQQLIEHKGTINSLQEQLILVRKEEGENYRKLEQRMNELEDKTEKTQENQKILFQEEKKLLHSKINQIEKLLQQLTQSKYYTLEQAVKQLTKKQETYQKTLFTKLFSFILACNLIQTKFIQVNVSEITQVGMLFIDILSNALGLSYCSFEGTVLAIILQLIKNLWHWYEKGTVENVAKIIEQIVSNSSIDFYFDIQKASVDLALKVNKDTIMELDQYQEFISEATKEIFQNEEFKNENQTEQKLGILHFIKVVLYMLKNSETLLKEKLNLQEIIVLSAKYEIQLEQRKNLSIEKIVSQGIGQSPPQPQNSSCCNGCCIQ